MWEFVTKEDAVFSPTDDLTGVRRKQARRTMKLVGNAVVPAQARRALVSLLQKLSQGTFRWPWMAEGLGVQEPARWPFSFSMTEQEPLRTVFEDHVESFITPFLIVCEPFGTTLVCFRSI